MRECDPFASAIRRRAAYPAILLLLLPWIALFAFYPNPCQAKIYKYQKEGIWYYTDAPPSDMPAENQQMTESVPLSSIPDVCGRPLLENYPARNAIEQAAAGTVAIKSPLGYGSGFFISPYGHIITNKHVIRSTDQQTEQNESHFRQVEDRIAAFEKGYADEMQRLRNFSIRLEQLRAAAVQENHPQRKRAYTQDYEENSKTYQKWREDLEVRRKQFESERSAFKTSRAGYDYSKSVADLAQSFTIVLADNTERYVRLIVISSRYDLALLKLDGYRVPALKPAPVDGLAQGVPVFAIGNPAQLRNSVTSGVFSGLQSGFIQTNAQIYPGNSGGPLVDEAGRVIGVNTFKKLTHKFEGLGFAIPIQAALAEFGQHLTLP
jgi:serine protease Do